MYRKIDAYTGARDDVLSAVRSAPAKVLDVGCSNGALGQSFKKRFPNTQYFGLEYNENFVREAREKIDSVRQVDLNNLLPADVPRDVDLVIFADVLEHLYSPRDVLCKVLTCSCNEGASVIISVPNVQHITVLINLIKGDWPERERGIFDGTHLRWFTLKKITRLLNGLELEILTVHRRYRIFDRPGGRFNKLSILFSVPLFRNFFTYQYIVVAQYKPR